MAQQDVPLQTVITDAVTTLARALSSELRRTMMGLLASVIAAVLLLTSFIIFLVVGIVRLGDALGRACAHWFGSDMLSDLVVGLVFVGIPVAGILLLRLRARK